MQRTILGSILDRTLETTWLAALVAVPALVNVYSDRAFEADKIALLRSLALVALALTTSRLLEGRSPGVRWSGGRQPLIHATLCIIAAALLSNAFGIAPGISFWGGYERLQGTYTLLACTAFFLVFVAVADRPQVERLVTAALLASIVPSLYAVMQVSGIDPIAWKQEVAGRVHSTAGNPIFLGAFLILVVPLSLARLLSAVDSARCSHAAIYAGLLTLQAVALACTQSRGPLLALGCGLGVFLVAVVARRHLRQAAYAAAAIAVMALVSWVFVAALSSPRQDSASALDLEEGTARVRSLVWQGTSDLIAAEPLRLATGYGLDTLRLVLPRFLPPELARLEKQGVTPDRAHNDVFDVIVHTGLLGLAARLFFIVALFALLLKGIGLLEGAWSFAIVTAIVVALAAVIVVAFGVSDLLGVAIGVGVLGGLGVHLLWRTVWPVAVSGGVLARDELIGIGLLASAAAHVAEVQVGIPTAPTELYLWLYAAAALVLVARAPVPEAEAAAFGEADLLLGSAVAVLLGVVFFAVYTPGVDVGERGLVIGGFLLSIWVIALMVAAASGAFQASGLVAMASFMLVSLGGGMAVAVAHGVWMSFEPTSDAALTNEYVTHFVTVLYGGVFALVVLGGIVSSVFERGQGMIFSRLPRGQVLVLPIAILVAVWAAAVTNLPVSRADVFAKQGMLYEQRSQWEQASRVYARALELQPRESRYALLRARATLNAIVAKPPTDPTAAYRQFDHAERAALRAWEINPLETDNAALVARVNRRLTLASAAEEKTRYRENSMRFYEEALRLSPRNAALWGEYAGFLLEAAMPEAALGALDRAVALGDREMPTQWMRAHALREVGRFEEALSAYDEIVEIKPELVGGWTGKALMLTKLGRPREAIEANQRAHQLAPGDVIVNKSLAALYRDQGQLELAWQHAVAARDAAAGVERNELDGFVGELDALRAKALLAQ
jgi:tetratricopeptide (TPR) repeat protein/O-antigen ligase